MAAAPSPLESDIRAFAMGGDAIQHAATSPAPPLDSPRILRLHQGPAIVRTKNSTGGIDVLFGGHNVLLQLQGVNALLAF